VSESIFHRYGRFERSFNSWLPNFQAIPKTVRRNSLDVHVFAEPRILHTNTLNFMHKLRL